MLADTSSLTNIIFLIALREMGIEKIKMENVQVNLVGFSGEQVLTMEPSISEFMSRAWT